MPPNTLSTLYMLGTVLDALHIVSFNPLNNPMKLVLLLFHTRRVKSLT